VLAIACCALPLAWIVWVVISHSSVASALHLSAFRLSLLARTIAYCACISVGATLIGAPVGLVLGRGRGWVASTMWVLVPAALLMSLLALAYGWSQLFVLLEPLLGLAGVLPARQLDMVRCLWTMIAWAWPIPALVIGLALRRTDSMLEQQAVLDGALSRMRTRLLVAPLLVSMAAVFVLATQQAAVFEQAGVSVVAAEVELVFGTGAFSASHDQSLGADGEPAPADQSERAAAAVATALPLLVVTLLMSAAVAWFARRSVFTGRVAAGGWPPALDTSRATTILALVLVMVCILGPVIGLAASLRAPFAVAETSTIGSAVGGSIVVGIAAAALAAAVAFAACVVRVRGVLPLAVLAFLIGGQLLAIAFIRLCNRPGVEALYGSTALLVLACAARFGWIALAAARSTWSGSWRALRDLADIDGAGPTRTATKIVWPLAWPMLLLASTLVGALALTEVPATVLLAPDGRPMLTPLLIVWVHKMQFAPMIEACLASLIVVVVPVTAVMLMSKSIGRARRRVEAERVNLSGTASMDARTG
jgi:ABC-type Fe3+ transport system permease subunit